MPREIITPWMTRVQQGDQVARAVEDYERRKAEAEKEFLGKVENAARLLAAFSVEHDIPLETIRTIRMEVALRLPQKPMTMDEKQLWLDEHCLGVVRFMMTGKIV